MDFIRMLTSVWFVLTTQILALVLQLMTIKNQEAESKQSWTIEKIICVGTLVFSALLFIADTYLLGFHMYLISQQLSTYRHMKGERKSKVIKQTGTPTSPTNKQKTHGLNVKLNDILLCGLFSKKTKKTKI